MQCVEFRLKNVRWTLLCRSRPKTLLRLWNSSPCTYLGCGANSQRMRSPCALFVSSTLSIVFNPTTSAITNYYPSVNGVDQYFISLSHVEDRIQSVYLFLLGWVNPESKLTEQTNSWLDREFNPGLFGWQSSLLTATDYQLYLIYCVKHLFVFIPSATSMQS